MKNKIPLVDLVAQYHQIKEEIDAAIFDVIENSCFIGGPKVKQFEASFSRYIGTHHCIGVGNGTDALFIALKALGIQKGDEVITAANTFIATAEAITATGAQVVFVDCHPDTYTINCSQIKEKINPRTKAIIPVHIYGHPADMDAIIQIARENQLYIIEDAAQAHGAKYKGINVGTFGHAACFSFYPSKNIGAFGDAGAILTNNEDLALKCRKLANHGRIDKYNHEFEGYNSRLDGIHAAILLVKLKYLSQWNKERRRLASIYKRELNDLDEIALPHESSDITSVYYTYVIRTNFREEIINFLKEHGIETGIHYPISLPFLKAYEYLGHKATEFPVTWKIQNQILSLPIYPEMTESMVINVAGKIKSFFKKD